MQKVSNYKCPDCGMKFKSLATWGNHVRSKHPNIIPKDNSDARYYYYLLTGKTHGNCIVCKMKTDWNELGQKYERFCKMRECKDAYRAMFKNRMIGRYGKVHLLDNPNQQRTMLANRKISGKYKFNDGTVIPYTGTYELDFLKMLDNFLKIPGSSIMGPSPHTYYYEYDNSKDTKVSGKVKKFYIPDFYIPTLNLEIEIKQSTNPNKQIADTTYIKDEAKDKMMKTVNGVNYIKILDKNYSYFFEFLNSLSTNDGTDEIALESIGTKGIIKNDTKHFERKLSNYKRVKIASQKEYNNIQKVQDELFTVSFNAKTDSCEMYYDGKKFVGCLIISDNHNSIWLKSITISDIYKGFNLQEQMIERAISKYDITNISIKTSNIVLSERLIQYGFRAYGKVGKFTHYTRIL